MEGRIGRDGSGRARLGTDGVSALDGCAACTPAGTLFLPVHSPESPIPSL